jgi:solute carrier family 35 protein F1/2
MLIQVFSIPSAVILSIIFLKIKYLWNHYLALVLCALGVGCSLINDLLIKPHQDVQKENDDGSFNMNAFYGDLMVLGGAFLYASYDLLMFNNYVRSNILQEYLLSSGTNVFNYLGFLGLFGMIITLVESLVFFREYRDFKSAE